MLNFLIAFLCGDSGLHFLIRFSFGGSYLYFLKLFLSWDSRLRFLVVFLFRDSELQILIVFQFRGLQALDSCCFSVWELASFISLLIFFSWDLRARATWSAQP